MKFKGFPLEYEVTWDSTDDLGLPLIPFGISTLAVYVGLLAQKLDATLMWTSNTYSYIGEIHAPLIRDYYSATLRSM
jgi:hypothetical protein